MAILGIASPPEPVATGKLTVHFLDVGQGDSAVIVFPGGSTMLIDGGGEFRFIRWRAGGDQKAQESRDARGSGSDYGFSVGEAVVSRFLWSLGLNRVDYLVATHSDVDHLGGLRRVVNNLTVEQAIIAASTADDFEFAEFTEALRRRAIPIGSVSAGKAYEIEGVKLELLWPPAKTGKSSSDNNNSIVLRLTYGERSVLFTGDIEAEAEQQIVKSGFSVRADVLKVPHHGSRTSSTEGFIDSVRPSHAVIPAGARSRFGHPHSIVLERYKTRGIAVLQTGVNGTVTVETDGRNLRVSTFLSN